MGMSQRDLARELGITQQRLSSYERCVSSPPATVVADLLGILNLSLTDLIIPKWTSKDKSVLKRLIDSGGMYRKSHEEGSYYNEGHHLKFDTGDGVQRILAYCEDEATAKDIADSLNDLDRRLLDHNMGDE